MVGIGEEKYKSSCKITCNNRKGKKRKERRSSAYSTMEMGPKAAANTKAKSESTATEINTRPTSTIKV
jgi:hypothetical protein